MITVDPKLESGTWFTHPDEDSIQFKIRPTSIYSINKTPGEKFDITLPDVVDMYLYCLLDWKGIGGPDNKGLKCTKENKMAFLNQYDALASFVVTKASEMKSELVEAQEAKNLKKSQPGETTKQEKPVAKTA